MTRGIRAILRRKLSSATGPMEVEVDLQVGAGERLALFGPSGSGKSSVLRMVAGLLRPDEGHVEVDGVVWFDSAARLDLPPHRRRPGMVFQDHALFPHRTAFQNILDGVQGPGDRAKRAREFLDVFELSGVGDHPPTRLSGGQKQRVALARTLASDPGILLLDEPFSALDASLRGRVIEETAMHLDRERKATILVSHDMGEVWRLADRVLRLEQGQVVALGPPDSVFAGGTSTPRLRIPATVLALRESEGFVVVTASAAGTVVRAVISVEEARTLLPGTSVLLAAKAFETMVLPLD
ncbi:MAG TPA: ATP-binding cassette domain-containing protein [Fibrobacteria bacterium]|nr:ATP-binding cassette domain-containing protein [Fibrobacteria bacterium]